MEFWNLIVQSNTFNFLIFIGLFALLFKKINFGAMMDKLQAKVMSLIEDAKKAKDDSIVELKRTQEISSKVPTEVRNILDNAEVTADRLGKRILEEAEKQVNSIYKTTDSVVESEGHCFICCLFSCLMSILAQLMDVFYQRTFILVDIQFGNTG